MQQNDPPAKVASNDQLGVTARAYYTYETRFLRPRYKLVMRVSTQEFRNMVAAGALRSSSWLSGYRRAGNTIPVIHGAACLAVFGHGDDIFLCDLPPRRGVS